MLPPLRLLLPVLPKASAMLRPLDVAPPPLLLAWLLRVPLPPLALAPGLLLPFLLLLASPCSFLKAEYEAASSSETPRFCRGGCGPSACCHGRQGNFSSCSAGTYMKPSRLGSPTCSRNSTNSSPMSNSSSHSDLGALAAPPPAAVARLRCRSAA